MYSWKPTSKRKEKDPLENASPDRYGDLAKMLKNKQRVIYSLFILVAFLITIIGSALFRSRVEVLVVEKDHNNYTYLGKVDDLTKQNYNPDDKSLEYFLYNFVTKARFLPTDLVLYKKNQQDLGYFLSSKSLKKLDALLEQDGYADMIAKSFVVDVELISMLRLSPETYQVRWFEKVYDTKGVMITQNVMVGMLRYEIRKPTSKEAILQNPLGIVITDLSISKEK